MAGITEVARKAGIDAKGVKEVLEAIKEIAASEKVTIKGFGTFEVKNTKPRPGRNPQTGEAIQIPAGTRFTFKPSKADK